MSLNADSAAGGASRISPVVLVVAVLVVAGVAVTSTALYFEVGPGMHPSGTTVTVVDDLGRTVAVPLNPSRVVVLAPSIVDTLYRLGLRDRIVGIGCTPGIVGGIDDEYTPNQTALWNLSTSMCIPDFPDLNIEALATLTPQLVLASTLTSATDVAKITSDFGIPVVLLAPSTLDGVSGDVELIAQVFPIAGTAAATLVSELRATIFSATEFDANLSNDNVTPPSVLLTYYFDGGGYYSYGPGSFGQSLVELAGGSSIASGDPLLYGELNATVVLNANPDMVWFGTSWNDPYIVSDETPSNWTLAPFWGQLTGTKVPLDIAVVTEADPSMVLALPELTHLLYPTLPSTVR